MPVEDVTVKNVNRARARADETRGYAPQGAGFRADGQHDIGPVGGEERASLVENPEILPGRKRSAEGGDVEGAPDGARVADLSWLRGSARQGDIVPAGGKFLGQGECDPRRSADYHAGTYEEETGFSHRAWLQDHPRRAAGALCV